MSEITLNKNIGFWSEVKKHFISVLIGAVVVGVPFYFKSMATDEKQTADISDIQTAYRDVNKNLSDINLKLSFASVEPSNTRDQVISMKEDVRKISDRQDEMSKRQDKMYEILIDLAQRKK